MGHNDTAPDLTAGASSYPGASMVAPRSRSGWRWVTYRVVTGPRFHVARLALWILQIPLVVTRPSIAALVMYVTILSIAAGIESSLTDVVEGWKFVAEESPAHEDEFEEAGDG